MVSSGRKRPSPSPDRKPLAAMALTAPAYQAEGSTSEKGALSLRRRFRAEATMALNSARVMVSPGWKVPS